MSVVTGLYNDRQHVADDAAVPLDGAGVSPTSGYEFGDLIRRPFHKANNNTNFSLKRNAKFIFMLLIVTLNDINMNSSAGWPQANWTLLAVCALLRAATHLGAV